MAATLNCQPNHPKWDEFPKGVPGVCSICFRKQEMSIKNTSKESCFCYMTHSLIEQLGKVGSRVLDENLACVISPLAYGCQLDEDFVGQISALSRTSNLSVAHDRVIEPMPFEFVKILVTNSLKMISWAGAIPWGLKCHPC